MTKSVMLSLHVRIALADSLTPAAAFALCFYRRWHVDVRAIRFARIQVGFKMFLGVTATCSNWSTDASGNAIECSLVSRPRHSSISQPIHHVRAPKRNAVPPVALRADTRCMYSLHVRKHQVLEEIPFVDYVELPASLSELRYSNILCGVIKGSLEQIGIKVDVNFVKDMLRGDDVYEMRVVLIEAVPDEYPFKDDE